MRESNIVFHYNYVLHLPADQMPVNYNEIKRYAGIRIAKTDANEQTDAKEQADAAIETIEPYIDECIKEADSILRYDCVYRIEPISVSPAKDSVEIAGVSFAGHHLAKNLDGCSDVVMFAATLGMGFDRLIQKYAKLSLTKAVIMQAYGAERIESLCDAFCSDLKQNFAVVRPRFSPGYGDLPLAAQKPFLQILEAGKNIGIGLNESLLMSPSKSVSAFVGVNGHSQNSLTP